MDSNHGPLVLKATALPTELLLQPKTFYVILFFILKVTGNYTYNPHPYTHSFSLFLSFTLTIIILIRSLKLPFSTTSTTRFGDFLIFLATNLLTKVAQKDW